MNEHIAIDTDNGKVTGILVESTDGKHYHKQEIFPQELREEYKKLKAENNLLKDEISKRDKMIKSLTDYIEALQKSRTPIVFTATKEELKDVQEFITKHVL